MKELARLVEKEIYTIINAQLKLVFLRHKIPEMTVLIRIADNFFAVNELTINGRLDHIKLGHKNYYPAKSLIKDCWILKSEREKIDNIVKLLDVNQREDCFNQILGSIETNIRKASLISSSTHREKFYKSRTTYSKYTLFSGEEVKQIENVDKQLIKVLTLSP